MHGRLHHQQVSGAAGMVEGVVMGLEEGGAMHDRPDSVVHVHVHHGALVDDGKWVQVVIVY